MHLTFGPSHSTFLPTPAFIAKSPTNRHGTSSILSRAAGRNAVVPPTKDQELLTEIRDLLKKASTAHSG